jgi:hypothetical protein
MVVVTVFVTVVGGGVMVTVVVTGAPGARVVVDVTVLVTSLTTSFTGADSVPA